MTPEFAPLGDSAVRAAFGDEISPQINRRVLRLGAALEAAPVPGVIEWVPGYATVTVYYQPWRIGYEELCAELERRWRQGAKPSAERGRLVTVPVCYGGEWGPDLPVSPPCTS